MTAAVRDAWNTSVLAQERLLFFPSADPLCAGPGHRATEALSITASHSFLVTYDNRRHWCFFLKKKKKEFWGAGEKAQ